MIQANSFDSEFFGMPCFRLTDPIAPPDLDALSRQAPRKPYFADAKVPASDLVTARLLLDRGFRRICTQVELIHPLTKLTADAATHQTVEIKNIMHLSEDEIQAHASHFETSRFRQDPTVPIAAANALYAQWIRNSLSGSKRIALAAANFCTFSDNEHTRQIDLLSVLDKRQGYARSILSALLADARHNECTCVRVITEVENCAALAVYRRLGFTIERFISVFQFYEPGVTR